MTSTSQATHSTVVAGLPLFGTLDLPSSRTAQLFVVVDTEEEFDWTAGFARTATSVTAMRAVHKGQTIFDRFGVQPTYVIDYPVVSQADGYMPLLEIASDGRCEIGAHLHPWVNPPHDEVVSGRNSFTMNLPYELQRSKLRVLYEAIADRFGKSPRVFKAGRYGIGAATAGLLDELGFDVDNSVSPAMDFTSEGGPDFRALDARPFYLTPRLLEVPCTIEFTGWAGRHRQRLHAWATQISVGGVNAAGPLAKLGTVNRIMLSPEGNTFDEMRSLTLALLRRGLRTFTLSFHSPSLAAGHTPYVRTEADLLEFLHTIERYCAFFFHEIQGQPGNLHTFRDSVP